MRCDAVSLCRCVLMSLPLLHLLQSGKTAISAAANVGELDIVKLLVDKYHADVDVVDGQGNTGEQGVCVCVCMNVCVYV